MSVLAMCSVHGLKALVDYQKNTKAEIIFADTHEYTQTTPNTPKTPTARDWRMYVHGNIALVCV